eukprot:4365273-Lingulodinium_polyedra.AAC.1
MLEVGEHVRRRNAHLEPRGDRLNGLQRICLAVVALLLEIRHDLAVLKILALLAVELLGTPDAVAPDGAVRK